MIYSEETQKIINLLFKDDQDFAEKLLNDDADAIQELSKNHSMNPMDIIEAVDNGKIPELYNEALRKAMKTNLYLRMVKEHTKYHSENGASKK